MVINPALGHQYFGTKTQLFAAASHIPIEAGNDVTLIRSFMQELIAQ
jgi:hypothetical protein